MPSQAVRAIFGPTTVPTLGPSDPGARRPSRGRVRSAPSTVLARRVGATAEPESALSPVGLEPGASARLGPAVRRCHRLVARVAPAVPNGVIGIERARTMTAADQQVLSDRGRRGAASGGSGWSWRSWWSFSWSPPWRHPDHGRHRGPSDRCVERMEEWRHGCRVAVVGGGISGFAGRVGAGAVRGPHVDGDDPEGSPAVGGKLRLGSVGESLIDVGAESVLARRPEAISLFEELGLADRRPTRQGCRPRSCRGWRWPMPSGTLMGVPSDPESVRGLLTDDEVRRLAHEQGRRPSTRTCRSETSSTHDSAQRSPTSWSSRCSPGVYAGHSRELSLADGGSGPLPSRHGGHSLLDVARSAAGSPAVDPPRPAPPVFATLVGGLGTVPPVMRRRRLGVDPPARWSAASTPARRPR